MPPVSAEATVSRNYIEWLVGVPWKKASRESKDLDARREDPERGPLRPREGQGADPRVPGRAPARPEDEGLDHLLRRPARASARPRSRKSIARSLNRQFVRLSLGGVRDEAEIRGHRRTYIGAFPGQIIQMMKKAGTVNPVFLLDEVDKMSTDFRGDPASALLEVLDPEQNHTFVDHYLDVEYDLSKVMFIATANIADPIPPALKDRMELIPLSGYTPEREGRDRPAVPRAEAARGQRPEGRADRDRATTTILGDHRALHARGGRAQPRARDRRRLPQGRAPDRRRRRPRRRSAITPENLKEFLGKPRFRKRLQGRGLRGRHRDGPRLDRGRRRDPHDRDEPAEGQGQPDAHRLARRRHAGVGPRRRLLRAQPRRDVRRRPQLPREVRHPHPRPRGGDPQGRPLGRHHDGGLALLGRDEDPGPEGRRDDRRDHAARQGAARSAGSRTRSWRPTAPGSGRSSSPPRTTRTWTTCPRRSAARWSSTSSAPWTR